MIKHKVLYLICTLILLSCGRIPQSIIMPECDTDLNLPLTNREYFLKDLIKEDKYIKIDSTNGNILYRLVSDTITSNTSVEEFIANQLNTTETKVNVIIKNAEGEGLLEFSNGASIDSAFIKDGIINIEVANNGTTDMNFDLTMPGLFDKSGNAYTLSGVAKAGNKYVKDVNLSGFAFSNRLQSEKNKIKVHCKVTGTDQSASGTVKLKIDNSKLKYVAGVLPTKLLQSLNRSLALPVKEDIKIFRDKVKLSDTRLVLSANYISPHNSPFEVLLKNVKIVGFRLDGTKVNLKENGSDNLSDVYITNGKLYKEFTSQNSNISEIIAFLPDSLQIFGDILMNPNMKQGIATDRDTISVKVYFMATSSLSFDYISYSDTLDYNFDETNRARIRNAKSARLIYEITNSLPLNADLTINFTDAKLIRYFGKSMSIAGATLVGTSGESNPTFTKSEFVLDSTEIFQLSESEKIVLDIKVKTTDANKYVILKPDLWLKILSFCELNYHLKTPK